MKRSKCFLLLAFCSIAPVLAGPDDYVEWKPIPGSSGYQVQVRDAKTGAILVDQVVEGTSIDVDLKFGHYQQRVAPLSPFGKPLQWSDWRQLNVLVALTPLVDGAVAVDIAERKPFSITLKGKNFLPNVRAYLKSGETLYPILKRTVNAGGKEITLNIVPDHIPPGTYSIFLENPRRKTWTGADLVHLKYPANALVDNHNPGKTELADKGNDNIDSSAGKDGKTTRPVAGDFREHLRTLPSTCKNSGLPDELVLKCYKFHIVLNLSTPEKVNLYNYLLAYQGNYDDRAAGYQYFRTQCGTLSKQVATLLEERLSESGESLALEEKQQIGETVKFVKACDGSPNP